MQCSNRTEMYRKKTFNPFHKIENPSTGPKMQGRTVIRVAVKVLAKSHGIST